MLVAAPPEDQDAAHRLDLTSHRVVAIDDASTTEVDDGLSVEELPDGRTRLWVHVADPTRWLQPGSPLDLEARRRSSTMYLPTGGDLLTSESGFRISSAHCVRQGWQKGTLALVPAAVYRPSTERCRQRCSESHMVHPALLVPQGMHLHLSFQMCSTSTCIDGSHGVDS